MPKAKKGKKDASADVAGATKSRLNAIMGEFEAFDKEMYLVPGKSIVEITLVTDKLEKDFHMLPEGTRGAPVARAATSSLFPPTEEGSNAPPPGTPSSRNRVGVPENADSAAAALETAGRSSYAQSFLCALWKSLPTGGTSSGPAVSRIFAS